MAPCGFPGERLEWGTVSAGGWVTSLTERNPEGVLQQISASITECWDAL